MTTITLSLGGRAYPISCDPGQEAHIADLGAMIEAKLATLPNTQAEARSLVFAALLLADDLHEAHIAGLSSASQPPAGDLSHDALAAIAGRLEKLASHCAATP